MVRFTTSADTENAGTNTVYGTAGCNRQFTWCEDTPAMNAFVFMIYATLLHGIAFPFVMLNLDTIFSKILGPIKQASIV